MKVTEEDIHQALELVRLEELVVKAAVAYYHDENCYPDFLEAVEAYEDSFPPTEGLA
jgi:hypothetical protein